MALLLIFIKDLEFNCIHVADDIAPLVAKVVVAVQPIYMAWRSSKGACWAGGFSSLRSLSGEQVSCLTMTMSSPSWILRSMKRNCRWLMSSSLDWAVGQEGPAVCEVFYSIVHLRRVELCPMINNHH